jgi:DNA-binding CsgD family transcriptional regulator
VCCPRPSGKRPYVIQVTPLHHHEIAGECTALLVVTDPNSETASAPTLLRQIYGLTLSEAEVAVRISRGTPVKQVAEQLSVSYTTVRTHLQHVYDKTDTHRQGDLVRLVLALKP